MFERKGKGFTLVELLAVIVILAVILVIAIPQITKVIKQTRENALASTAKLICSKAEEKEVENDALEVSEAITCTDLVKLDDNYNTSTCTIEKNETTGKWEVFIEGAAGKKFAGISATGTKDSIVVTNSNSSNSNSGNESGNVNSSSWLYSFTAITSADDTNAKTNWEDVGKPLFLRYNANDLTEVYLCTTYNSNNGGPICFSANAYNEYTNADSEGKTQTEWNEVIEKFATGNCYLSDTSNSCSARVGEGDYEFVNCSVYSNSANCDWTDSTVGYVVCGVDLENQYNGCDQW